MVRKKTNNNNIYQMARYRGRKVSGLKKLKRPAIKTNKLRQVVLIGAFMIVVALSAKMFLYQRAELHALIDQKKNIENEILNIQEETRSLQQEATMLDDPEYIGIVARNEYGMVGKEDIVFIPARSIKE